VRTGAAVAACHERLTLYFCKASHKKGAEGRYSHEMSKQALGNVLAGVAFLIVAIVDVTRDSSGIGVVFLVFAAVFLGLGLSGKTRQPPSSPQGD
jgi:hypothetical protein